MTQMYCVPVGWWTLFHAIGCRRSFGGACRSEGFVTVDYNLINTLNIDDSFIEQELAAAFGGETDLSKILQTVEGAVTTQFQSGAILKGKVVNIVGDDVVVDVGLKSEEVVPANEWEDLSSVDIGDTVDVLLEAVESETGVVVLSKRKADRILNWQRIIETCKEGDTVKGKVTRKIKGGLLVDIGVPVFLPASQVDIRRPGDINEYLDKEIDAKVLKIDTDRRNIVISRRKLIEEQRHTAKEKLLSEIEVGQLRKGVVKNITEFGAFVDLGGIDGLLHITDMAWRRVRHPSEVVTAGQEITAKILKFDTEKNRVSLGLKQMGDDPWMGVNRRYPQGTRMFGKITNIADYGAFVELEPGIEGLVHVSEMDWTNKNVAPSKIVALGDEVEVMVLEIDEDKRRISLGMKQCKANPWQEFAQNTKRGDRVKGPIKSITDFGVFVGLAAGIDGLVHLSDLSWNEPGETAVREYKKGQEVEALVLAVDVDRERISLGIKQLDSDPFTTFVSINDKGQTVTGKVKTVDAKGAEIDLGEDIIGYLRASEISRDRVEDARNVLKEGDEVTAVVVNVDRKTRNIQLSIKAKDMADQNEAMQSLSQQSARENAGTTSLGALLRAKLDNN